MPPQIEKTVSLNENENTEQLSSEDDDKNVVKIPKYLLILLLIQWVSLKEFFCKLKSIFI